MIDIQMPWPEWQATRVLGRGRYGTVYRIERSEDFGQAECAAMKVIPIPRDDVEIDAMRDNGYSESAIKSALQTQRDRVLAEYGFMARVSGHPNIVQCLDRAVLPRAGGGWNVYIRMELLKPLVRQEGLDEAEALKLGRDICSALVVCHEQEIIHRDVKPGNIMVSRFGKYKLGDFGVARTMDHTTLATTAGTAYYMAPEVRMEAPYGKQADVYSLGLVLYWMLNNRRLPFEPVTGELTMEAANQALYRRMQGEAFPAPEHGGAALAQVVLRSCAFRPGDRYRDAQALLDALEGAAAADAGRAVGGTVSKPAGAENKPAGAENKPAGAGNKPAGTGNKPAGTVSKPAGAGNKPAGAVSKPAGTVSKPAGTGNKPADTVSKPADTGYKPADTVSKPAGTGNKPADTGSKPAGTGGKPAGAAANGKRKSGELVKTETARTLIVLLDIAWVIVYCLFTNRMEGSPDALLLRLRNLDWRTILLLGAPIPATLVTLNTSEKSPWLLQVLALACAAIHGLAAAGTVMMLSFLADEKLGFVMPFMTYVREPAAGEVAVLVERIVAIWIGVCGAALSLNAVKSGDGEKTGDGGGKPKAAPVGAVTNGKAPAVSLSSARLFTVLLSVTWVVVFCVMTLYEEGSLDALYARIQSGDALSIALLAAPFVACAFEFVSSAAAPGLIQALAGLGCLIHGLTGAAITVTLCGYADKKMGFNMLFDTYYGKNDWGDALSWVVLIIAIGVGVFCAGRAACAVKTD